MLYEGIRINGGGNTYLLSVFLNPDNRSATLNVDRTIWMQVFQNDRELYGLAGQERIVGLKEDPGAAQIAGYPFAASSYHG